MALVPTKSPTYETQTPRTSVVDKNFVPEQVLDFSFRKMTDLSGNHLFINSLFCTEYNKNKEVFGLSRGCLYICFPNLA